MITASTASAVSAPPSSCASSASESWSMACAAIVFSTVFGSAVDCEEPRARNSNLLPVNANGEVRLRSPPCIGRCGSTLAPSLR